MDVVRNIIIGLITGMISGVVSGVAVTSYYNWKSDIDQTYYFWLHYLSDAFTKSGMPLPIDEVRQLRAVGGQDSEFGKTYAKINARMQPLDMEKKLPPNEAEIAKLSVKAWKQLDQWYDHISKHRFKYFVKHILTRKQ